MLDFIFLVTNSLLRLHTPDKSDFNEYTHGGYNIDKRVRPYEFYETRVVEKSVVLKCDQTSLEDHRNERPHKQQWYYDECHDQGILLSKKLAKSTAAYGR